MATGRGRGRVEIVVINSGWVGGLELADHRKDDHRIEWLLRVRGNGFHHVLRAGRTFSKRDGWFDSPNFRESKVSGE